MREYYDSLSADSNAIDGMGHSRAYKSGLPATTTSMVAAPPVTYSMFTSKKVMKIQGNNTE